MSAENLTAARFGETLIVASEDPTPELPTVVLALGPTLTAEIDPNSNRPVRLASEKYTCDKGRIEALLGADAVYLIDAAGDGNYTLPFNPGSAWDIVLDLAMQHWNLDWNPLPLDPKLLALDLLRAQHEAITLTGTLPDNWLAKTAYPAAQTLQRLLDADAIAPGAQQLVARCVDASRANTPLNHSDTTPYILPMPLTPSEISTILDPAPAIPGALATGSPDWRLTGHGPAATAENAVTVLPHTANPAAITITTPAKPHTHPEKTPIYQALITDPLTGQGIASTNLRYVPETETYTGHTTPRRPIIATDQVDIRHPRIPTPPTSTQEERESTYACRQATRAFVASFAGRAGTAVLAATGKLLIDVSARSDDIDLWSKFESVALTGVRSTGTSPTGKTRKLSASIEQFDATAVIIGGEGKPWILRITSTQSLGRIRVDIRWDSGEKNSIFVDYSPFSPSSVALQSPHSNDTPQSIRIERADE